METCSSSLEHPLSLYRSFPNLTSSKMKLPAVKKFGPKLGIHAESNNMVALAKATNKRIFPLADVPNYTPDVFQISEKTQSVDPISLHMQRLVSEFELITWLNVVDQRKLSSIFISEVSMRFNNDFKALFVKLVPQGERRKVLPFIFQCVKYHKDKAVKRCKSEVELFSSQGIYEGGVNMDRMLAIFRLELRRRINPKRILESVLSGEFVIKAVPTSTSIDNDIKHMEALFSSLDNSGAYSPASNIPDIVTLHNLRNSIREEVETELAIEKAVARKRLEIDEFVNKAGVASYYDRNRDANHSNSEVDLQLTADQANMGLFSSSETSDNISSNALLLANFDSASPARERRRHSTAASLKRERYIPFSDRHGASLTYQNLEGLDYSNNRNEKGLSAELPFQNLSMNANREENTFRTCELRLSERVPKGRIDIKSIEVHIKDGVVDYTPANKPLIVENRNVVTSGKSISESVSSNPNSSAPFTRAKEVEELFDSVMKGMGGDHLKCVEGPKARLSPAATFDSNLPIPPAFLCRTGIANVSENESPPFTPVRPTLDKTENRVFEHKIQLLPRRPDEIHVTADEFIVDRERAMAKVPSSKLSSFKYNFGGYIPQATVKVKKEAFALNEFWDYMQTKTSDFLLDILKDRFAARFEEAMKLSEQKKAEESDSGKTVKTAKVDRKKVVLPRFEPGAWSPAFLDYMKLEISRDAESEKVDVTQNSLEKIEEHREESVEETEVRSSSQSNYPTDGRLSRNACESTEETTDNNVDNRSQSVQYEPSDNPPSESPLIKLTPQERLENIWDQLHIDDGARLDMAMRYGSDSYVLELASLLALWEDVTRAIIEREELLHELRLFELDHSDPERLFMPKATAISWKQETERREELLQRLEKSTETVKTTISELDQKWPGESEKVTFKGKKYLDKFRKDYSELQYEVSLIRGNRKNANNQSTPVEDSEEGGTCG